MDFYKGYENLIEFSSATVENPFGAQLLSMCEDVFEDVESAVVGLTEALAEAGFDVDEDGVVGLMTGQILPSEELVDALTGLTESETEVARLYNSAAALYEAVAEAEEAGDIEVEDDEDFDTVEEDDEEYDDEDEDEIEVEAEAEAEPLAAQLYSRQVITDTLNEYLEVADRMVEDRYLTPHVKDLLFGKSDKNRFVNFSAACEEADASPAEYLKCIEFALNLFAEIGPSVNEAYFTSQVNEPIAKDGGRNIDFSANDDEIVSQSREMVDLLGL